MESLLNNKTLIIKILETYLDEIISDLDFEQMQSLDVNLKIKEGEPINEYKVYKIPLKDKKYLPAIFLFVLITEPYELVALTMYRLASDIHWYFIKQEENQAYPFVVPVLLYYNDKDWTPKSLQNLLANSPNPVPEFHFEFIDLKHGYETYL